jgi:hypothetical protein
VKRWDVRIAALPHDRKWNFTRTAQLITAGYHDLLIFRTEIAIDAINGQDGKELATAAANELPLPGEGYYRNSPVEVTRAHVHFWVAKIVDRELPPPKPVAVDASSKMDIEL